MDRLTVPHSWQVRNCKIAKVQNNEKTKQRKYESTKQRKYETTTVKKQRKCESAKLRNNENTKQRKYEYSEQGLKSCENLSIRWPDCVHVGLQSFSRSGRPSTAHVPPSQRSYCVLQCSPAIDCHRPRRLVLSRSSSVHVQSSAFLYRTSGVWGVLFRDARGDSM